jgi:hypothetical protein
LDDVPKVKTVFCLDNKTAPLAVVSQYDTSEVAGTDGGWGEGLPPPDVPFLQLAPQNMPAKNIRVKNKVSHRLI